MGNGANQWYLGSLFLTILSILLLRSFILPLDDGGLIFQRVNYHAKVWLNGTLVGEHLNGYLPFEIAASPHLRSDGPNTLVVRVDNAPRDEWLPGSRTIEWVQYGGILQPVTLETTSSVYLSDLAIVVQPDGAGAQVRCAVEVTNESASDFSGQVRIQIQERTARAAISCASCSTATVTLTIDQIFELRQHLNDIDDKTPEWEKVRRMGEEVAEEELAMAPDIPAEPGNYKTVTRRARSQGRKRR